MRAIFEQTSLAATALGVIFAICNCFLGYRLRKLWISLIGFGVGGLIAFAISMLFLDAGISTLIGVAVGAILALVSFKLYLCGVFLLCGGLFFLLWSILMPTDLSQLIAAMLVLCGAALSILIGIIAVKSVRPMVMLLTAFVGGYTALSGAFTLFHAEETTLTIVLGVLLGVAGLVFQIIDDKHRRKIAENAAAYVATPVSESFSFDAKSSNADVGDPPSGASSVTSDSDDDGTGGSAPTVS